MSLSESELQRILARHPVISRGIEKENLRVGQDARLASSLHPEAFGAKQTHPFITTDFAEAQMEVVTGVHADMNALLAELDNLYRFIYSGLGDAYLWPYSMPCQLSHSEIVPAWYGHNNEAQLKQVYRSGLGLRYGKMMQAICGIHYNFSVNESFFEASRIAEGSAQPLQDYISQRYMGLVRNFLRSYWLLPYLFGASPLLMKGFLSNPPDCIQPWDDEAQYAEYATSLRVSRLGYQNNAQSGLKICYNSIEAYANSLLAATQLPYAEYEQLGMTDKAGHYQQLNGNILQIENEYYSPIRPKRIGVHGERPAQALLKYGVAYIEVRILDINPFMPLGMDESQIKFMDLFLLHCLLTDSPDFVEGELARHRQNFNLIAAQGRRPGLMLEDQGPRAFSEWAESILSDLHTLAQVLDQGAEGGYVAALLSQQAKLYHPELTPSAKLLQTLSDTGLSLSALMLQQALMHQHYFATRPLDVNTRRHYEALRQDSINAWQQLESAAQRPFVDYLQAYLHRK